MELWYFLDDERFPPERKNVEWKIFRDPEDLLKSLLRDGLPDGISFDHDLGEGKMTGYDVMKKIIEFVLDGKIPYKKIKFEVHSANPVGAENIKSAIKSYLEVLPQFL